MPQLLLALLGQPVPQKEDARRVTAQVAIGREGK